MSSKYEKEIEEILKRAEDVLPKDRSEPATKEPEKVGSSRLSRLTGGRGFKISAGKLMLASFALLLLAMIVGATGIGNVVYLVVAGLILFVIAYALFFVRPSPPSGYEKRWRGRLIEDRPPSWTGSGAGLRASPPLSPGPSNGKTARRRRSPSPAASSPHPAASPARGRTPPCAGPDRIWRWPATGRPWIPWLPTIHPGAAAPLQGHRPCSWRPSFPIGSGSTGEGPSVVEKGHPALDLA